MSDNLDLKKTMKHLYNPSKKEVSVVDVPRMNFLMIDGHGNPNTSEVYRQSVSGLYQVAYGIRAIIKKREARTFTVMPLEGLWWADDMASFSVADKDAWQWTMTILQPDFVTADIFQEAQAQVMVKKDHSPKVPDIRFEAYTEGPAVQIMHIGPYADEAPNIQRLHAHIAENGHELSGKHHEIYLSDPNKVAPEKLKTVIRQPFA